MADKEKLVQENTSLKARLFDAQEIAGQLEKAVEARNNIIIQIARMVFEDDTLEEVTFDQVLQQVESVVAEKKPTSTEDFELEDEGEDWEICDEIRE